MRILHAIRSVNPAEGGPIEGVRQFAAAHTRSGREVEVVCLDAPADPWVRSCGLRVHALGPGRGRYGYGARFGRWLAANATEFDVVVVNGLWQYHGLAVWRALRHTQTPYYVFPHGMLDPWFKRQYPLKHLKKWLYWPWAEYRVLRDARAVLFTCRQEAELARNSFWLARWRAVVLGYGTQWPPGSGERQRGAFLAAFPECRDRRLWVFLGRLHAKKGCDLLLDAFARCAAREPRLHLVLAGPDPAGWQAALQARARRLGVAGRTTWPGMVQGDLKWGALHGAEVLILPSHQENFGIVVAEALGCGLPVLISDRVNIWREVQAAGAGLVGDDDFEGTLSLCSRWLALSVEERRGMGERARHCFETHFHIDRVTRRLADLWQEDGVDAGLGGERTAAYSPAQHWR